MGLLDEKTWLAQGLTPDQARANAYAVANALPIPHDLPNYTAPPLQVDTFGDTAAEMMREPWAQARDDWSRAGLSGSGLLSGGSAGINALMALGAGGAGLLAEAPLADLWQNRGPDGNEEAFARMLMAQGDAHAGAGLGRGMNLLDDFVDMGVDSLGYAVRGAGNAVRGMDIPDALRRFPLDESGSVPIGRALGDIDDQVAAARKAVLDNPNDAALFDDYKRIRRMRDDGVTTLPQTEAPTTQAGSGLLSDYVGQHQAPTRDGGAPAFNLAGDIYPDDIYSSKAVQYYGTGSDAMDKKTMSLLQSLRGNPDSDVTIYRAVPKGVDNLNAGDWVTVNRQYARDHGESALGGDFDIIEKKVKAGDIFTNGDSIHEFGYDPAPQLNPAPAAAPFDMQRGMGDNGGPRLIGLLDATADLPPHSRPEWAGAAENRTTPYPRYDPARGAPDRMQRLTSMLDDPQNKIHDTVNSYVAKGQSLGGDDWYNTE